MTYIDIMTIVVPINKLLPSHFLITVPLLPQINPHRQVICRTREASLIGWRRGDTRGLTQNLVGGIRGGTQNLVGGIRGGTQNLVGGYEG